MSPYFSLNKKKFCFDLLIHLYLVPTYFLEYYINTPPLARVEEGWIGRVCLITLMFLSEVWSLYHLSSTELLTPCLSAKICPVWECCLNCSHASCKGYDFMWENRAISLEWLLRSICLMLLHMQEHAPCVDLPLDADHEQQGIKFSTILTSKDFL